MGSAGVRQGDISASIYLRASLRARVALRRSCLMVFQIRRKLDALTGRFEK